MTDSNKRIVVLQFVVFAGALAALWWLGHLFRLDTASVRALLRPYPLWLVGFVFIVLYVAVTFFLWLSKDVFRLVAAIVFGPYLSTLFVWVAECINAVVLFSFARCFGRGFIASSIAGRFRRLDTRLGTMPLGWVMLIRLAPLVAYRFMDIAAGLSSMRFRRYMAVVVIATPLRVLWLQVILAAVGEGVFDPKVVAAYLERNLLLFGVSCVYAVLMIIVAFKLKKAGTDNVCTD